MWDGQGPGHGGWAMPGRHGRAMPSGAGPKGGTALWGMRGVLLCQAMEAVGHEGSTIVPSNGKHCRHSRCISARAMVVACDNIHGVPESRMAGAAQDGQAGGSRCLSWLSQVNIKPSCVALAYGLHGSPEMPASTQKHLP